MVGTVALVGAAVIPGPNVVLVAYGGFNLAQAGGFELLRQHAKKKRKKNDNPRKSSETSKH